MHLLRKFLVASALVTDNAPCQRHRHTALRFNLSDFLSEMVNSPGLSQSNNTMTLPLDQVRLKWEM